MGSWGEPLAQGIPLPGACIAHPLLVITTLTSRWLVSPFPFLTASSSVALPSRPPSHVAILTALGAFLDVAVEGSVLNVFLSCTASFQPLCTVVIVTTVGFCVLNGQLAETLDGRSACRDPRRTVSLLRHSSGSLPGGSIEPSEALDTSHTSWPHHRTPGPPFLILYVPSETSPGCVRIFSGIFYLSHLKGTGTGPVTGILTSSVGSATFWRNRSGSVSTTPTGVCSRRRCSCSLVVSMRPSPA